MDSNSTNENEPNQENGKSKDDTNNKTINSDQPKISSNKVNSNKNINTKKEEKENNDNLVSKTPKNEEQKSNKKYEKELELIKELKKDNYKKLYLVHKFCDYRTREEEEWEYGIISQIDEDSVIIEDIKKSKKNQIKIDDSFKLSYFRKYSEPTEENHLKKRENIQAFLDKIEFLEKCIKKENNIFKNENKEDAWEIFYFLHSKIFFSLDYAMKINQSNHYYYGVQISDDNVGAEESFRIILCILYFLSQYYKYILENKDDFFYYQNIVNNAQFEDLKIVNQKCAFFSFFNESLNLLSKIFANSKDYLIWFLAFEKEIKRFLPSIEDEKIKKNPDFYPPYEEIKEVKKEKKEENGKNEEKVEKSEKNEENEKYGEKNDEKENGNPKKEERDKKIEKKLILKKICLSSAYNYSTTYTSEEIKIKAPIVAYFIDYFHALNGFSYLYQLCYCNDSISLQLLLKIFNGLGCARSMTGNFKDILIEEKKQLLDFISNFIENLNEKTIVEYKNDDIINLILKTPFLTGLKEDEYGKILQNLFFNYSSKNLLLSKKLEQKISSLNKIKDILKCINKRNYYFINNNKNSKIKMNFEEFCQNCKNSKILQNLFNDKNVHEEIIKRLPEIIFVMYKYNFGYKNIKEDEDKINFEKKMIFNVLLNKLLESEQNNEKLVKNIQNIICNFCDYLSEEDKLYIYKEIKKYLEKSIEKKGIPMKDHLLFIIDFSLKAISTNNNENEKKTDEDNKKDKADKNENEEINKDNGNTDNTKEEEKIDKDNNKNDDKSLNIDINEDNYYGLSLLLNYLSEEQYKKYSMTNEQKIELINSSIEGIIQIMENYENNDLLIKYIIFKAISSIKSSKNVIQYLILFEKTKKSKEIDFKFNIFLEEFSNKYGLLPALISDMNRYLSLIDNTNEDRDKTKEGIKVYEGFFDNELNIKSRLELILFLLQKNINDENLNNFKTQIINSCKKNNFAKDCLNKYINDNLKSFDLKIIEFFYDNILSKTTNDKENLANFNDLQYYKLCNEIIKQINKANKIFYFMNNKDLAVLNCESEKEIKGIDLLWNFLIKTNKNEIRKNVTEFLSDIFFGIRIGNQEKRDNYWKNFIKSIYDKLDEIIKLENDNRDNKDNSQSIQGIISLIKKIENKFTNKGEIIDNISQILNEINFNKAEKNEKNEDKDEDKKEQYKKIIFSGNKYGTDNILNYDIKIDKTEYFYMFRYKLSSFFKIPVNLVKIIFDESIYDKQKQEKLKDLEFDLFNDFDNTYSLIENIEQKINMLNNNNYNNKENILIFKVEAVKENEKIKYIKKLIKDFPRLIKLLKREKSEYILDVWCLIKEDSIKISPNIIEIIKEILNEDNSEKLNSTFNFKDTNIYYISYILFHLNNVINELNKANDKFINEIFLKSKIWNEKIKNIKLENSPKPHLGEIYEKNKIINYLLNIYKIISQKTDDITLLLFILNKIFDYYYQTINECISINLKSLSSTEGIRVDSVEDLYITNTTIIKEIIIQNKIIYDNFIKTLFNYNTPKENNSIQKQFEFLFSEGLIKNRINSLNLKLQSFLYIIIDDKFFTQENNEQNKIIINDFYLYLLNFFLSLNAYNKVINCIKDLALDKRLDVCLGIEKYENNIKLYYDIIINVIDKIYPIINNKFNFKPFINDICLNIIYNPIIKGIPMEISYNQIIFGGYCKILLNLLMKTNNYKDLLSMKENDEKKLKHYLFDEIIMNKCNNNIFTEKNIDNYKSISITSSYAFKEAVNLFIFLVMENIQNENEEEMNYFFNKLTDLHKQCYWKGDNLSDWKLDYKESNKLSSFIGLKNLGCTCYMNSLLQVFFNFIPFRESLLKCRCKEENKNSLYQVKKLFYSLKYLQVNYYTPNDFPYNFDDEVLNVHQQMDVDEFFGNILDKIENRLKNTKNENLVKYFFQGRQNDLLTFQDGCSHHRTNIINFYSIQLQVQNKKNIYESLDTLTEGELMNGENCIFCPECKKKCPAVKSQNFKNLPRMLIFVLKRFEFNYETMKKVKINDYYEFPLELDMTKYISEKKDDENLNKFTLKSVVVHLGNCEGGHYYAYIKTKNGQWYEFNDTQVIPFDISLLKEETYGGEEIYNANGNKQVSEKNRSAYLLFYEKKIQTDCEQFDNIEAINSFLHLNIKKPKNESTEDAENIIDTSSTSITNGSKDIINNDNKNYENETKDINENDDEIGMKDILENLNNEMFKYFLNKKLFSNEYQYFILELYLNILNYYYSYDLTVFLMHLCRNANNTKLLREISATSSNLISYIEKNKLFLFSKKNKPNTKPNQTSQKIINLFKHFIIYFYNVFLRTKQKEYLGGMVDLMKFLLNDQPLCANYLIEEFCNQNTIIEYLMNCPVYEIKKLIVGILYCAMIKSVNDYEISIRKNESDKKKQYNNKLNQKSSSSQSIKDDEAYARQLSDNINGNENSLYNSNPLEYENIPKNILKMIYNILHIIRDNKYNHMNEYRFLYFTIYRFSLISENTRIFLINKCRLFELLCLLLHNRYASYSYDTDAIIHSTYIGPYTVSHDILNTKGKKEENIIVDKVGQYRNENYIYLLFFYLLSYTPKNNKKILITEDSGYSLENKKFVSVLLNNIRTRQDAFSFSNYINEKSKNNKSRIIPVFESLIDIMEKIDYNENQNYDYNNYNNFVNNNMNENPNDNDPGINPKYLLMIVKRFISTLNLKNDYVQKGIKLIFKIFWKNKSYYNYCIMMIDFLIELFYIYLRGVITLFKKDLEQLMDWLESNPISPTLYEINGLSLYKYEKKNYDNNVNEKKIKEFEEKEIEKTKNKINTIKSLVNNESINVVEKYENDIDISDFQFIIGDIILYDNKECVIEEALDESIKITIEPNKKNGKKEMWIDIDNPKIEIKELKGK